MLKEFSALETSLVVWWLRLHPLNSGGPSLIPWSGNLIPHAATDKYVFFFIFKEEFSSLKLDWISKVSS